jgi:hypothetical protein
MAITATVSGASAITSIVRSDGKSQVVSSSVPGPKGDSGYVVAANEIEIGNLADIMLDGKEDGSVLQYNMNTCKWHAKNNIEPDAGGTVILNGGNF